MRAVHPESSNSQSLGWFRGWGRTRTMRDGVGCTLAPVQFGADSSGRRSETRTQLPRIERPWMTHTPSYTSLRPKTAKIDDNPQPHPKDNNRKQQKRKMNAPVSTTDSSLPLCVCDVADSKQQISQTGLLPYE
jgi:hypothetical protein